MTHESRIGEIDHIFLASGIGFCHWPLSSWLERHRDAGDHPGWDPLPMPNCPLQPGCSRLVCVLNAELQELMTAPRPE
jgi:hypothetical protein